MAASYVPQPVYPKGFDTNRTLYEVANFGETTLAADLQAWATSINVEPVSRNEIWSSNGFCTINGELIYYNSVVNHSTTGKVIQLKDCIRNLNNSSLVLYKKNTPVRQFVVAQHHNSLARAIVNIQNFIGYQDNSNIETIDAKIKKMSNIESLGDDCECPQANFSYKITNSDALAGITISYSLIIYGKYNSFQIDFGDGTVTNTATFGTHVYTPNVKINPIARVFNSICDCAQTTAIVDQQNGYTSDDITIYSIGTPQGGNATGIATGGGAGGEGTGNNVNPNIIGGTYVDGVLVDPTTGEPIIGLDGTGATGLGRNLITDSDRNAGTIIPTLPEFPEIDVTDIGIPPRDLQLPAIVFPALDAKFGPISVPSTIEIIGKPEIPSVITINTKNYIPSFISFGTLPEIPSFINIIQIDPIPSFIEIGATEIQLLNSDYCVNCTEKISCDNVAKETIQAASDDGCRPCQYFDDNAKADGNEIEKIQVVVHDFFVTDEYGDGSNRWDAVKILIKDPIGKNCLILGSGPTTYNEDTIPKYAMIEPITLIFDDNSSSSIYKWDKKLVGGSFKTSANDNWQTEDAGLAIFTPPAPTAPYGTSLSDYADKKLPGGLWKAYVVVGDGPVSQCSSCLWKTFIIGMTNNFKNPSYLYDWKLVSDCGPDCGCPKPTEYPTAGATKTTQCKSQPPEYKIPITNCNISKICIRIFYSSQNPPCPDPTPTPTPTATRKVSFYDEYVPLPTPSFTSQPIIKEKSKILTKRNLFESQALTNGTGEIEFKTEIGLPFNFIQLENISDNLNNEVENIEIKSNIELQYMEKINENKPLIVPIEQSINVDINNLFGEK